LIEVNTIDTSEPCPAVESFAAKEMLRNMLDLFSWGRERLRF